MEERHWMAPRLVLGRWETLDSQSLHCHVPASRPQRRSGGILGDRSIGRHDVWRPAVPLIPEGTAGLFRFRCPRARPPTCSRRIFTGDLEQRSSARSGGTAGGRDLGRAGRCRPPRGSLPNGRCSRRMRAQVGFALFHFSQQWPARPRLPKLRQQRICRARVSRRTARRCTRSRRPSPENLWQWASAAEVSEPDTALAAIRASVLQMIAH